MGPFRETARAVVINYCFGETALVFFVQVLFRCVQPTLSNGNGMLQKQTLYGQFYSSCSCLNYQQEHCTINKKCDKLGGTSVAHEEYTLRQNVRQMYN